jgi:hypothetical protein
LEILLELQVFVTGELFSVRPVIYQELWSKGRNFGNGKVFKIKE